MSKRELKNIVLFSIFLIYIFVYKLFLFPNFMKYSGIFNASFMIILLTLSIWMLGFRKDKPSFDSKNITRSVILHLLFVFIAMYALGFIVGFLKNAYSRNFWVLIDNIFAPILIIVFVELFRYVVIWANKDKKRYLFLFTFILILFESTINIRSLNFFDAESLFRTTATIILPVIVKNIVLSYLCYHVGFKVPLLYRLVMDVYLFIVPIIPDIGEYLNSMILIALPILIYISAFSYIDERHKRLEHLFEENNFSIWDIPVMALLVTLAALVSGFFPYYMIGVGSNSMSPSIHKGDAVILKKVSSNDTLKKGDVIAYRNGKRVIVHRIEEVTKSSGKTVYVTKGDANNGTDTGVVSSKQIKGIVKVKIPYIAYPTVWVSENIMDRSEVHE